MASSTESKLLLWDHGTSSYAQKVRIALREKGIPFVARGPQGLGLGGPVPELEEANPRVEVPALEDGEFKYAIFDSTVILNYLEDKYEEPRLLPADPQGRATARMVEEICDTVYEATNWVYSEIVWSGRAEGELATQISGKVKQQTQIVQDWLASNLGDKDYFNGKTFGYADICVAPLLNRSVYYGLGPAEGSPLQKWHARIKGRESVKRTFEEMEAGAAVMSKSMRKFLEGGMRREYRDHRLEAMIKLGGLDVVLEGLRKETIRFGWPEVGR